MGIFVYILSSRISMKFLYRLLILLVTATVIISLETVSFSAITEIHDGIEIYFDTDSDSYDNSAEIKGHFKITNHSGSEMTDITAKMTLPDDDYSATAESAFLKKYDSIDNGKSVEDTVLYTPQSKPDSVVTQTTDEQVQNSPSRRTKLLVLLLLLLALLIVVIVIIVMLVLKTKQYSKIMVLLLTVNVSISFMLSSEIHISAVSEKTASSLQKVSLTKLVNYDGSPVSVDFTLSFNRKSAVKDSDKATESFAKNSTEIYAQVLKNLASVYGKGEIVQDKTLKYNDRYCLNGLALVRQIDFDNDGNKELLCFCGRYETALQHDKYTSAVKVYRQKGNSAELIYNGSAIALKNDAVHYLEYVTEDDIIFLHTQSEYSTKTENIWSSVSDEGMEKIRTFTVEKSVYRIDGKSVEKSVFQSKLKKFESDKYSLAVDNQKNRSAMEKVLAETQKNIQKICPDITYPKAIVVPTEKPTVKPTVKPTEKPTSAPTEQPTVIQQYTVQEEYIPYTEYYDDNNNNISSDPSPQPVADWRTSYKNKLYELLNEDSGKFGVKAFELLDTDNDGIPELFYSDGEAHNNTCSMYFWNGYSVEYSDFHAPYGRLSFNTSHNYIGALSLARGFASTEICQKRGNSVEHIISYSYGGMTESDTVYEVNGNTVSYSEFSSETENFENLKWGDVGRAYDMNSGNINSVVDNWSVS